ncbi:MAG: hypothetical protein A2V77_09110 [Anaeromyxobacter sp. RBG_16_69_14]|nr:MAG: hypothetical protein A2V77_09110 [Anaeromyxobacter sp. RBG_16_69_14]
MTALIDWMDTFEPSRQKFVSPCSLTSFSALRRMCLSLERSRSWCRGEGAPPPGVGVASESRWIIFGTYFPHIAGLISCQFRGL